MRRFSSFLLLLCFFVLFTLPVQPAQAAAVDGNVWWAELYHGATNSLPATEEVPFTAPGVTFRDSSDASGLIFPNSTVDIYALAAFQDLTDAYVVYRNGTADVYVPMSITGNVSGYSFRSQTLTVSIWKATIPAANTFGFGAGDTVYYRIRLEDDGGETDYQVLKTAPSACSSNLIGQQICDLDTPTGDYSYEIAAYPSVSINDATGSETSGLVTFTVTRSPAINEPLTLNWSTSNGSALAGGDYTPVVGGTVTIPANSATATFGVTVLNDSDYEPTPETFNVTLTGIASGSATIIDAAGVGTINDNDPAPQVGIAFNPVSPTDFAENGGTIDVRLFMDRLSAVPYTVNLSYGGTATNGTDYSGGSTTVTINSGLVYDFTLTGINDALVEGDEPFTITVDSGTGYTPRPINLSVSGTIIDDDVPTATVQDGSDSENAGGVTAMVRLSAPATVPTTFTWVLSDGTATTADNDYVAASGIVMIQAGMDAAAIWVTVNDDGYYEADEDFTVTISGPTTGYATIVDDTARLVILNDDMQPSVTLSLTGSPVPEDSGTATVTATLSNRSYQNVTVNLGYSGTAANITDYTAPASIIIPAGSLTGTATITGVNDWMAEGSETVIVNVTSVTNGTESGTQQVTATITENYVGISMYFPPFMTISEGTGGLGYTIRLRSMPTDAVIVTWIPDMQCNLGSGAGVPVTMVIAPANWTMYYGPDTRAVDDAVVEGPHTCTMTHTVSSLDPNYNGFALPSVTVNIIDNDVATVTLSLSGSPLVENGGTATVTATLTNQSYQDVTVDLGYSGTVAGTDYTAPSSITIPAGSLTGTATITGVDDALVEGNETVIVDIASVTNGTENGTQQVTATITDDDVALPTVTLSLTGSPLAENGGAATVTATLSATSAQNVIVDLGYTGTAAGTDYTAPASITIPAGSLTGTATITGVDDALAEGNETVIVDIASVTNGTENGTQQVTATITDDDIPGVTVTPTTLNMTEGGASASYSVVLNTQPNAVGVIILIDPGPDCSVGPGMDQAVAMLFDSGNWNTPQTLNVTVSNNGIADGPRTCLISQYPDMGSDIAYRTLDVADVTVNITDDDPPGITVTPPTLNLIEGGAGSSYQIALATPPTSDVTIGLTPGTTCDVGYGVGVPAAVLIPAGTQTATVNVTAPDDAVVQGPHTCTITQAASGDPVYTGIAISNVTVNITDNDTAVVTFTESGGTTAISEAGSTMDTYTVSLVTAPSGDVTISLTSDADCAITSANPIIFAAPNQGPITITVQAVDDTVAEGLHTCAITHTITASTAAEYPLGPVGTIAAQVIDNDAGPIVPTAPPVPTASAADHARAQAPLCANLNGSTNPVVRARNASSGIYCRVLAQNSVFIGNGGGEVGSEYLIDLGVIQAVDVFGLRDTQPWYDFSIQVCLQGEGSVFFLDATTEPRALSLLPSAVEDGYTCAQIPNAGTVVLVP